jgi:signal transduction histidine kinase/CheY-like chemotaxis protein
VPRSHPSSPLHSSLACPVASFAGTLPPASFIWLAEWEQPDLILVGCAPFLCYALWWIVSYRDRQLIVKLKEIESRSLTRIAELEQASVAQSEFLADLSHEILNPLYGIVSLSASLQATGCSSDRSRRLEQLHLSSAHLSCLLEDLIELSKGNACVTKSRDEPFDLHELIKAVGAIAEGQSVAHAIPIETSISPDIPRWLRGDARRVRQILLNLLGNAQKYSGHGAVTLTVSHRPTNLPQRTEVTFAVIDEGPGIPAQEKRRLFHRFVRGEAARSKQARGAGLGLGVCRALAEKMGGRVWLESASAQGSCFCFSAVFDHTLPSVRSEWHPPSAVPTGARPKALLVDDLAYNRTALRELLETLGYAVTETGDARVALAMASQEYFELVVLDHELPPTCAPDVARTIRNLTGPTSRSWIIAISAHHPAAILRACHEAGINKCLRKPATLTRLAQALAESDSAEKELEHDTGDAAFARLHRLAAMRQKSVETEFSLFKSEMEMEWAQLGEAVAGRDATEVARCVHKLSGRLGFIQEYGLARQVDRLGAHASRNDWPQILILQEVLAPEIEALQRRLISQASTGQPV